MNNVVIVAACRTAIGRFNGAFKTVSALDLTIPVIKALIDKSNIDAALIDDVLWGCNYQKTYLENNLARVAAIKAGLPVTVPGITLHRNCASSMSAVQLGYYQIRSEEANIILAGGTDSMSNAQYTIEKLRHGAKFGHVEVRDSMWDSLTNLGIGPAMGMTAENLADRYHISRNKQDKHALLSNQRTINAIDEGRFKDEIVPIEIFDRMDSKIIDTDEHPKRNSSLEALSKLKPSFKKDGTVTAGNASGINDGASGVLLMSEKKAKELKLPIMARIISTATAGVDPAIMGIGPVKSSKEAMKKVGLTIDDIDLVEINEAFSAQYLACEQLLSLNREITNVNGSGVGLGHPVGATGTRIITTLLYEMKRRNVRRGLAALCAGGGMGTTVIFERETPSS